MERKVITSEKETQTYDKYVLGAKIENMILRNQIKTQSKNIPEAVDDKDEKYGNMNIKSILKSQEKTKYFTWLDVSEFWILYDWLGDAKFNLQYWNERETSSEKASKRKFTPSEELFLTLLRLRRGFNLKTISYIYGCSIGLVSSIFSTWIMLLYSHFKDYQNLMFPTRRAMRLNLPKVFQKFKNIRASIDCTEFFCEMPKNYARQGNMYSAYKHHTTFKCLIAVNPNGGACFVSDLYEGNIDDVSIFDKCGLMNHIEPGDAFLVDKGFTVQTLLLSKQATIYIPPFLGNRESFTQLEVLLTKRIAKARIHVERYNARVKQFRLVSGIIPLSLTPIASQLVYVACCLANFQQCLCT